MPELRAAAAHGLGQTGSAEAIESLRAALRDPSSRVRGDAAYALLALRAVSTVPDLVAALSLETDTTTRNILVHALGEFGSEAVSFLSTALEDTDPRTRYLAALALGGTHDPAAADALLAATDDPEPSVRTAVLYALTALIGERAIPPLLKALDDQDAEVRYYAVKALTWSTGQQFGEDPTKWREWWGKQQADRATP